MKFLAKNLNSSRIRKNVTDRQRSENRHRTENRQTEKPITKATLIPDGLDEQANIIILMV